jgi:hypothetical protein
VSGSESAGARLALFNHQANSQIDKFLRHVFAHFYHFSVDGQGQIGIAAFPVSCLSLFIPGYLA